MDNDGINNNNLDDSLTADMIISMLVADPILAYNWQGESYVEHDNTECKHCGMESDIMHDCHNCGYWICRDCFGFLVSWDDMYFGLCADCVPNDDLFDLKAFEVVFNCNHVNLFAAYKQKVGSYFIDGSKGNKLILTDDNDTLDDMSNNNNHNIVQNNNNGHVLMTAGPGSKEDLELSDVGGDDSNDCKDKNKIKKKR